MSGNSRNIPIITADAPQEFNANTESTAVNSAVVSRFSGFQPKTRTQQVQTIEQQKPETADETTQTNLEDSIVLQHKNQSSKPVSFNRANSTIEEDIDVPKGEYCSGERQSPIDLRPEILTTVNYPGLYWGKGFFMEPLSQELVADSHSVVIRSTFAETPYIGGGPLKECYKLHSIHFHWATTDDKGSEHTLDGKSYPMEMHVVMTKGNLTMEEARATPDGITVLGYFIDILPYSEEPRRLWNPFTIITKTMNKLQFVNTARSLIKFFEISNLTILFHYNYITYEGSLTTGDCNEVVTWIISPKILKISSAQLQTFRGLFPRNLMTTPDNYRDVQPLNDRQVFFVKDTLQGL